MDRLNQFAGQALARLYSLVPAMPRAALPKGSRLVPHGSDTVALAWENFGKLMLTVGFSWGYVLGFVSCLALIFAVVLGIVLRVSLSNLVKGVGINVPR